MKNHLFSSSMIEILTSFDSWKIISSSFPSEIHPVVDLNHQEWMRENSHAHAFQEILFVLRGEGCYGYRQLIYPYASGTAYLFDSMEEHDNEYPEWLCDADHLWLRFSQTKLICRLLSIRDGEILNPESPNQFIMPEQVAIPAKHALFNHSTGDEWSSVKRLRIYSALTTLILEVIQAGYERASFEDKLAFQERIIMTIQRHIQETAGKGINTDSLAVLSGYSKSHFERLFKQYTGQSVHHHIDECRMTRARQMLDMGYTKKEISHALGFSCPSVFSRWYKVNIGDNY